jgi:hypothetical protein
MITELHNFAVKYELPIISYVQLNRDGIDGEDTGIIAGSDRILWLCSSLSIFKNKDDTDVSLGCGWEHGNKKLLILATRQGSGLETEGDYINLKASINPHIGKLEATGLIREGHLYSKVCTGPQNANTNSQYKNRPGDSGGNSGSGEQQHIQGSK